MSAQPEWEMDPLFSVDEGSEPGTVLVPVADKITEVPTAGKVQALKIPADCDVYSFKRALSAAFQTFLEFGRLDAADISRVSGVPLAVTNYLLTTEEFSQALELRGIDPKGRGQLTAQQDAAIMILSDIGSDKTWAQKLREAGITQAIFTAWLKNPTFSRRWSSITEELVNNHNTALVSLAQKAGEGDLRAVELQLAVAGRYSANQQAQIDVMAFMNRVLDILTKHLVEYPEVLKGVAQDLRLESEKLSFNSQRVLPSKTLEF